MRQPYTVLVFPFRRLPNGAAVYAVFRRADDANWQSVSGGVEGTEDLVTAARRETVEETGLDRSNPMYKLSMVSGVARICFAASRSWPAGLYIVPKHFYAMDASADPADVVLSSEHKQFGWIDYEKAYEALRYDDDKTALWELNSRILNRDLPPAIR